MSRHILRVLAAAFLISVAAGFSQDASPDRVTVPFSDPSRPGTVTVSLLNGGITVKAHAGKDVIVEARVRPEERDGKKEQKRPETAGMRRIVSSATGLDIEEENNQVSVRTTAMSQTVDITLQVPAKTSLRLKSVNDGDIKVDQVQGEIEVNAINGAVTLTQVSGSVVAHALNGDVKVTLASIEPNKPMSFTSLNGDIDVTFPPEVKASVVMKTDQGEIFSDFEIKLDTTAPKPVTDGGSGKAKFKLKFDSTMRGTLNGGGPEMQFKTFNGDIFIRRSSR
jgi:DUF4097 and DUF4098 domain-containing protein YvlB